MNYLVILGAVLSTTIKEPTPIICTSESPGYCLKTKIT